MKFATNNVRNTLSLKVLLIAMLGLVLNGCTTNESESSEKGLPETQEQTQPQEPAPEQPEQAQLSPELQAQQEEAEREAQEQAKIDAEKKAQQAEADRLALKQAKLAAQRKVQKEKADRLLAQQAKKRLQKQEEMERLVLQQAKLNAQREEAERLAQLQEQEALMLEEQEEQKRLAQLEAEQTPPLTEQEALAEAEELAQQLAEQETELLAQQEAELLAQYEGARKAKIEQALSRLARANYAFESKREVFVDGLAEIEVVMQLGSSLSTSDMALLDEQFKVSEFVKIKLQSSNSSNLTITPISEELQSVSDSINPKWKWSVMAKKEGSYSLLLNIMPLINIKNPDGTVLQTSGGNKTITEVIEVMARPFSLWDWSKTWVGIITIVIGTIITGVLINVLINLVRIKLASNKLS
jgi:hypothetical protein